MKQGGVLVPRKYPSSEPLMKSTKSRPPMAITASYLWHLVTHCRGQDLHSCSEWKMVRKAVDVQEAAADQGASPLGLVAITVPLLKI